ncbi:MAG: hypothetical protein WCA57_17790, partial [Ilumatobacteraceae bacterium]
VELARPQRTQGLSHGSSGLVAPRVRGRVASIADASVRFMETLDAADAGWLGPAHAARGRRPRRPIVGMALLSR